VAAYFIRRGEEVATLEGGKEHARQDERRAARRGRAAHTRGERGRNNIGADRGWVLGPTKIEAGGGIWVSMHRALVEVPLE
jgi:hypothetical protein